MKKYKSRMLEALKLVSPIIPALIYWHDRNGVVLGANEQCLKELGATAEDIIGKNPYDFYDKELAEYILKHNEKVMESQQILSQEETTRNFKTGKLKHYISIKSPLYDDDGGVIGIIGTSIDITAEKELEQLRLENAAYQADKKIQQKLSEVLDNVVHVIQSHKVDILNDTLGIKSPQTPFYRNHYIRLSKREEQVLYLLSLGKTPKNIAKILSIVDAKLMSPKTVSGVINKQLYIKLDANNYSTLIEKATKLNLLQFMPKSLMKLENLDDEV